MILPLQGVIGFVVGGVAASFATTAALRSLRSEPAIVGRSRCDHCGISLSFLQTAPVLSYVRRRGACATCGGAIDAAHPIGEAVGAIAIGFAFLVLPPVTAGLAALMALLLLASSVIDARSRRLPDVIALGVAVLSFLLAWARGGDAPWIGTGACIAAVAVLLALRGVNRVRGRDPGLGLGDVKLIGALALWLGWQTPCMVAGAAGLAILRCALRPPPDGRVAFGPMIGLAAWCVGLGVEAGWWPEA